MEYEYDVTLSFAGEDREYVEEVAKILQKNDIKVFYDKFEEAELWGKDLGIHFEFVYRRSAKYCIPFVSQHYAKNVWTIALNAITIESATKTYHNLLGNIERLPQ